MSAACAAPPDGRAPPNAPSDAELVARVRAGDEGACEALYLAYYERLWRFAYGYVRSRAVAEELVQEVFLAVWRGRAAWTVAGPVRAWLYAAVRNQALYHLRQERTAARLRAGLGASDAEPDRPPPAMAAAPHDAHAVAEARDLEEALTRAIAALPERRRTAILLRWRHDLAPQEIALVLGTTPEVARVLLSRARRDLAGAVGWVRR